MKLHDDTELKARLFRGEPRAGEMLATLVVATEHPIGADGRLGPAADEGSPPLDAARVTELGPIPADTALYKHGVDVWVLGHVVPPRPTAATTVELVVGDELRALLVVGDRVWRADGTFTPPVPFERMPLVHARAYGGRSGAHAHPGNPDGRGFVGERTALADTPLPNVEWTDDRVRAWTDRPEVAGFAPVGPGSPLHLARAVRPAADTRAGFRLTRQWFRCAHDRLQFAGARAGTAVTLRAMAPGGPLGFVIPACGLEARVRLGTRDYVLPLTIDTIGIFADERRVRLVHRASFRYRLVRHQERAVRLRRVVDGGAP